MYKDRGTLEVLAVIGGTQTHDTEQGDLMIEQMIGELYESDRGINQSVRDDSAIGRSAGEGGRGQLVAGDELWTDKGEIRTKVLMSMTGILDNENDGVSGWIILVDEQTCVLMGTEIGPQWNPDEPHLIMPKYELADNGSKRGETSGRSPYFASRQALGRVPESTGGAYQANFRV